MGRLDQAVARIRNIHRKATRSNRREKLYARRRTFNARIVNGRNDNHRGATTAKARSAGQVVFETSNVSGMVRNRRLSGVFADAGMAGFLTKLEYKYAWYGAKFMKADRWFASSGLCAH